MSKQFLQVSLFLSTIIGGSLYSSNERSPSLESQPEPTRCAPVPADSSCQPAAPCGDPCCFDWYFEALPGYYYPYSERFRDVYGNGGFNGQGEIGAILWDWVGMFVRGGAYWDTGKSTVFDNKTTIVLGTVTGGVKFFFPFCWDCLDIYFGAGVRGFFLRIDNKGDFVKKHVNANNVGAAIVGGFMVYPFSCWGSCWDCVFLDIFADYSISTFKFKPNNIASLTNDLKVDGPTVGIGIGVRF